MLEWLTDDPKRGQVAFMTVVIAIVAGITWVGRKRLKVAVPIALVVLLWGAVAGPGLMPARPIAQRNSCIAYLHMMAGAKAAWAAENRKQPGDLLTMADLCTTNNGKAYMRYEPICPRGGVYALGGVGLNPTCSLADKGHKLE